MKQDKMLTIILAIANVILIVFCVMFLMQADREAPEFNFHETEIVYRNGMDVAKLLEGITSYDKTDGDVSKRIVVEKIIEDEKENTVVVYYAVSDRAGNVAKCSRVFPAILLADDTVEVQDAEQNAELLMEAGVLAELDEDMKEDTVTEPEETSTPTPTQAPTPMATLEPTPTPEPEATPMQEEVHEQAVQQPAAPPVNPAAPVLTLNTNQIIVQKGNNPPWVNNISVLKDDKDSYETLFYNLKFSKYDVNEPGSYPVTVYTEDSDGNQSAPVSVTIIVN